MVTVFEPKEADTPVGKPVAVPMPVAPEVVWVILVKGILIHKIGLEEAAPTVFAGVTVIVPVAVPPLQPPVSGIE